LVKDFNNWQFFYQTSRFFSKTSSFRGLFSNSRRDEVRRLYESPRSTLAITVKKINWAAFLA